MPPQTQASEDVVVESEFETNEDAVHSPSPSSFQIILSHGEHPQPLRVVLPIDKDPIYPSCLSEPTVRWSILVMEKAKNKEDIDVMILGESSSTSRRCVPLSLWERPTPSPCS